MWYAEGDILTPEGFVKGYLGFTQERVMELKDGTPPEKPIVKGLILPAFVNAHTHLGDSFIKTKNLDLPRNITELVAPPNGLKHRFLREATEDEILSGIRTSLHQMIDTGTSYFCDFREGGISGVLQLRKAMKAHHVHSVILSRPVAMKYEKEEVDRLLQNSDGIGLSSISDWESSEIEKIARHARQKKKLFALHASELQRENINQILDLKPNLLIHMIAATEDDLIRVKQEHIPIVLCPRSYLFFRLKTNYELMKKHHLPLLLGTDNAMINTPSIIEEVRTLLTTTHHFSLEELLIMITYSPRKALNLDDGIQALNPLEHFVVLERDSFNLLYNSMGK